METTLVGLLFFLATLPTPAAAVDTYVATATLVTNPNQVPGQAASNSFVLGTITFTQIAGENKVNISGTLTVGVDFAPITPNNWNIGFHIHTTSNFTGGCASAGMHYNPNNMTHGGPLDKTRHVGDLGNVQIDPNSRKAVVSMIDTVITLVGRQTIIGRSLVLHRGTDDLGTGTGDAQSESLKTGNAGDRYACGPIVLASDFSPSAADSLFTKGNRMVFVSLIVVLSIAIQKFFD